MEYDDSRLKTHRVLSLFGRLNRGEIIKKATEAKRFNVTGKSIQRDIDTINEYLVTEGEACEVVWDPALKGYNMTNKGKEWLVPEDVLAIAKVLLESRAFCKPEMDTLLDKLLSQVSSDGKRHIQEIINNEKHLYKPVKHGKALIKKLWTLSKAMSEQWLVQIQYQKENDDQVMVRIVEPQGIIFSEYYFYLIARIHNAKYKFPATYRIDRIQEMTVLPEHYKIIYSNRFEEGEFRKRIQFMHSGPPLPIKFKYWGNSLEAVMDRLPMAEIKDKDGEVNLIEAEVYGRGVKMWLLSQAEYLEVVEPKDFREEMKCTIDEMATYYRT